MIRHDLSWRNFRDSIMVSGERRVHLAAESPRTEIFFDSIAQRLGCLIECANNQILPPEIGRLRALSSRIHVRESRTYLEFAIESPALYREFYQLTQAVVDRIFLDKSDPVQSVLIECAMFGDLVEQRSRLSIERQMGLLGELLILERHLEKEGSVALDSWTGPLREIHDFRAKNIELEVKTTICARRMHVINGLEQFVPTQGKRLFLVSIMLAPAGSGKGFSLVTVASRIAAKLAGQPRQQVQFQDLLEACGYRQADCDMYSRPYTFRRPIGLVEVDDEFPALRRHNLERELGVASARIDDVTYTIDVEGLVVDKDPVGVLLETV
jgi:hypothetical protein